MMPSATAPCPHDRRPGITVCLHCRRAERQALRARRRRSLGRLAARLVLAVLLIGVVGAGVLAVQGRLPLGRVPTVAMPPVVVRAVPFVDGLLAAGSDSLLASSDGALPADSTPAGLLPIDSVPSDSSVGAAVATAAATIIPPPPPAPPLRAVIAEGRTDLRGGIFAVRKGDTIAVHFDTPSARTRRPDKLEAIVRATLPAVYGVAADSILARMPRGALVAGTAIGEVVQRGLRLALADGWTLALHPETRPGRDGPLVVTYRATVAR